MDLWEKWEAISIKVNMWHPIFDWNSTTYVETYVIPKMDQIASPDHITDPPY